MQYFPISHFGAQYTEQILLSKHGKSKHKFSFPLGVLEDGPARVSQVGSLLDYGGNNWVGFKVLGQHMGMHRLCTAGETALPATSFTFLEWILKEDATCLSQSSGAHHWATAPQAFLIGPSKQLRWLNDIQPFRL